MREYVPLPPRPAGAFPQVSMGVAAGTEINIQIRHIWPELPVFCMLIMAHDRLNWRYAGKRIAYADSVIEVSLGGRLT